jgi:hypothetical protein
VAGAADVQDCVPTRQVPPHRRVHARSQSASLLGLAAAGVFEARPASAKTSFVIRQTCSGFGLHVRVCWPGVISRIVLAPANIWEPAVVPMLADHTVGLLVGDRNDAAPRIAAELAEHGVELLAPPRHTSRDPYPSWNLVLSHVRYRIDTVFGQLAERFHAKRIWARASWHLWSR